MSQADRERWDRKYARDIPRATFEPSPLLVEHADFLDGRGLALDVACGIGQNSLYLADRGYEVVAVDGSIVGLRHCRRASAGRRGHIHLIAADLDSFPLAQNIFSVALVFRFLDRTLTPRIKRALAPGGLILYETFNVNRLRSVPQMNRGYLLEVGELAGWFADFECIATNDRPDNLSELTHWVGWRPDQRKALLAGC